MSYTILPSVPDPDSLQTADSHLPSALLMYFAHSVAPFPRLAGAFRALLCALSGSVTSKGVGDEILSTSEGVDDQVLSSSTAPPVPPGVQYEVVIGADVLYEPPHVRLVAAVVHRRLARGGACILALGIRQKVIKSDGPRLGHGLSSARVWGLCLRLSSSSLCRAATVYSVAGLVFRSFLFLVKKPIF